MSSPFQVESRRSGLVESVHHVSVAVTDRDGRLVARAGNPELVTFWRSGAKPVQAVALVADGAADRFGFTEPELALTCASHSSEPAHLALARGMLQKIGLGEEALACGPHVPLSPEVAERVVRDGTRMTPAWNNCSGKHAGMLALALAHDWPARGYEQREHPVQGRILEEILAWTGADPTRLGYGVDGCTVVTFALPLHAMATAYARIGCVDSPVAARIRNAMMRHPHLIAGEGRLETELGRAIGERGACKVGAEGTYSGFFPGAGLGLALKVEDGSAECAGPALLAVIRALAARVDLGFDPGQFPEAVTRFAERPVLDTRGRQAGTLGAAGSLQFLD